MNEERVVLVVGATGVIGRSFIRYAGANADWSLVGVQRSLNSTAQKIDYCAVDLLDFDAAKIALKKYQNITDIVYAGYVHGSAWQSATVANTNLLRHAVQAVEAAGNPLKRVVLLQGMKYYGSNLGPFRTPAKETDARLAVPNFYYDQEDYLVTASQGKSWDWVIFRPHVVCGATAGSPLNIVSMLGAYAVICRDLGLPLDFPGTAAAFEAISQATDAQLLAKAISWGIVTPECSRQAFNVTNGDFFRWKNFWPKLAEFFNMKMGVQQPVDLAQVMTAKEAVWNEIVRKHGLNPIAMEKFVYWPFGNYIFSLDWDVMASTTKIRQYGFSECLDTEDMFLTLFRKMQDDKQLPR